MYMENISDTLTLYNGAKIPGLGFGVWQISPLHTAKCVKMAIKAGYRNIDTAEGYMNEKGVGEGVRQAMDEYGLRREDIFVSTKLWNDNRGYDKAMKAFEVSLKKLGLEYLDYYFLHAMGRSVYGAVQEQKGFEFMARKKAEGKIRHIGFSYHDDADILDRILTDHPETELVQLQLNYIDWENESVQSRKCYEVCVRRGVQVTVMEPLKGGALVRLPEAAEDILKEADPNAGNASWGIRFAASLDQVMVVLSGMSDLKQVEDNISYMKDFRPLTEGERETIAKTVQIINDSIAIPCTACRYCTAGCPKKIAIPEYFALYNNQKQFGLLAGLATTYGNLTATHGKPQDCIGCKQCENHCPQHLPIVENLKLVAEAFGM